MTSRWTGGLTERAVSHVRIESDKDVQQYYEFKNKLGEGNFGVVLRATLRLTGLDWAIKVVNKEKAGGQAMKLIEWEVGILKRVDHASIIHLKEIIETPRKIYLVLELCERGELAKMVKAKHKFSEDEVRSVTRQLASGISYLHRNNVCHRDLKLENILIQEETSEGSDRFHIKVTDFGLSIVKSGSNYYDSMLDGFCGTPMYMAPEIVEKKSYSHLCDCWAIGVIIYALVCSCMPFSSNDEKTLYDLIMEANVTFIEPEWSSMSSECKQVVKELLSKDTTTRLSSHELLDHSWITGSQKEKPRSVFDHMREFNENETQKAEKKNVEIRVEDSDSTETSSKDSTRSFPKRQHEKAVSGTIRRNQSESVIDSKSSERKSAHYLGKDGARQTDSGSTKTASRRLLSPKYGGARNGLPTSSSANSLTRLKK